jgi:hypothetical protein
MWRNWLELRYHVNRRGIVKTLMIDGGCASLHQKRIRNTHFTNAINLHHCNLLTREKQQIWNTAHSTTINKIVKKNWTVNTVVLRGGLAGISGSGSPNYTNNVHAQCTRR